MVNDVKGHGPNLDTIIRAARSGDLAIVDCQDKHSGHSVAVLAAIGFEDGEYVIVPFARMFDGNPYDELNPPNPDGGYVTE